MATIRQFFWLVITIWVLTSVGCKSPVDFDVETQDDTSSLSANVDDNLLMNAGRLSWQRPSFVIAQLGDIQDKTIADIGAGAGYFAFRLAYKGANVIATDIDDDMINLMDIQKMNLPVELQDNVATRLATTDDVAIADGEVHHVLIINVIAYIDDKVNYLRKLKSKIKPDGKLLIVDYKMKRLDINGPPNDERIALKDMENLLIEAGYKINKSDDTSLKYQYLIIAEQ